MKIQILTLNGKQQELECTELLTIRELRNELSQLLKSEWNQLEIFIVNKKADCKLSQIYLDDYPELLVAEFVLINTGDVFDRDHVSIMAIKHDKIDAFRPTKHNPKGLSLERDLQDNPRNRFFLDAIRTRKFKTFKQRLADIEFPVAELPLVFKDALTNSVMENPIITLTQKSIDLASAAFLMAYDETMASLYQVACPNLLLKSRIEDFVAEQERLRKQGQLITVSNSESFLKMCDSNIHRIRVSGRQFDDNKNNIGLDLCDSPYDVDSGLEAQLFSENFISMSIIGKLDKVEVAKLLVMSTIYNVVMTDIKRRGYSNLLTVFAEAKDVYDAEVMPDTNIAVDVMMKLHRSRWLREGLIGRLVGKLILPVSARCLKELGFFQWCEAHAADPVARDILALSDETVTMIRNGNVI